MIKLLSRLSELMYSAGPIFEKELLIASRRRRMYLVRSLYLLALAICTGFVWYGVMSDIDSGVYTASRMAAIGSSITTMIIWFQFLLGQLLAASLLSTAINDEIYHKTLAVLMTTPLTSLQIVLGKLFSRLLQLFILLAVSLPMLAIIRFLGGVPWAFALAGVSLTLCCILFAGSCSLYFSVFHHQSHKVVSSVVWVYLILFFGVPALYGLWILLTSRPIPYMETVLTYINPFACMAVITDQHVGSGISGGIPFIWPISCLVMLFGTLVWIVLSISVVRRVGLRQATGEAGSFTLLKKKKKPMQSPKQPKQLYPAPPLPGQSQSPRELESAVSPAETAAFRRVTGSPVFWKEQVMGNPERKRRQRITGIIAVAIIFLILYGFAIYYEEFRHGLSISIVIGLMLVKIIGSMTYAATLISKEREARTWPLLMSTPLPGRDILLGKGKAALAQHWQIYGLLAAHLIVFAVIGEIHPAALIILPIYMAGYLALGTSLGLLMSSLMKRSSNAVAICMAVVFGSLFFCLFTQKGVIMHPLVQGVLLVANTCTHEAARESFRNLTFEFGFDEISFVVAFIIQLAIAVVSILVSAMLLAGAQENFRRKMFVND